MAISLADLDAHEQPSDTLRAQWKHFSRLEHSVVLDDPAVDDPRLPPCESGFQSAGAITQPQLAAAFSHLDPSLASHATRDVPIIYHPLLPGLLIAPDLVPAEIQPALLDRMLHRDLSNPAHQTNMHLHYDVPYPDPHALPRPSLFGLPASEPSFTPKDSAVHKPLTPTQVLNRRLHWVTLGGQYDWTNRVYPSTKPPAFPADLAGFLEELFPQTRAQAAIVNMYTPGDTMMMHRDVSEEIDRGLVSLSLGCDALFMIAPSRTTGTDAASEPQENGGGQKEYLLLRLRSGDAIYMTEESRYAWHGVPKVVKGTCPAHLADWPATDSDFEHWRGWMANKRINLNVRQMHD